MKRLVSLLFRLLMKFPGADQVLRTYVIENDGAPIRESLWGENAEQDLQDALLGQDQCELRTLLATHNFALLHDVAAENRAAGLNTILKQADTDLLRIVLDADGAFVERLLTLDEAVPILSEVLLSNERRLLKHVLSLAQTDDLKALLFSDDFALFREMAIANDGTPLKNVFFDKDYRLLRTFLSEHSHEALKAVVLDGPGEAFRVLVTARQGKPLADLLFADDYRVLREILSLRGYEALKATVLDGPDEVFRMLAIARQGEPLADLLFADNARVLCDLCRRRDNKDLRSLFGAEKERLLAFLEIDDLITALEGKLPTIDFPETALQSAPLLDTLRNSVRWKACIALSETWNTLKLLLPERDTQTEERFLDALGRIREPAHVRGRILDVITEEDVVHLAHGSLRFPCRHSLWTLLHEILLYEDYFFSCDTDAPRIIDGGTHMGMAIYYFKTRYPKARIIGFEPLPFLREMANENIARNEYRDVTVLPYALSGKAGEAQFHVSDSWTMAGSLHDRRSQLGDDVRQITVECVPLSKYLDEPVHFLKLDIEGAEAEVLTEAAHKLNNVQYLFCEFHQGAGLGSDRLAKILSILEAADFEVQVGKSHNYQQSSLKQPFTHFDGAASMLIWARNRSWPG